MVRSKMERIIREENKTIQLCILMIKPKNIFNNAPILVHSGLLVPTTFTSWQDGVEIVICAVDPVIP